MDRPPADRAATLQWELSVGDKSIRCFLALETGSRQVAPLSGIIGDTGCRSSDVSRYQRFNQWPIQPFSHEHSQELLSRKRPPESIFVG